MVDAPSQRSTIPPLENGDRLNRFEFERRYAAMPDLRKAELIEGIVYVPAALRFRSHEQPHSWLITWLGNYAAGIGIVVTIFLVTRLRLGNALPRSSGFC